MLGYGLTHVKTEHTTATIPSKHESMVNGPKPNVTLNRQNNNRRFKYIKNKNKSYE
jgi:hypothetical protein